ncbi:MAG TPA: hypothetical protein VIL01_08220 [Thermomicrobiales bacterium]
MSERVASIPRAAASAEPVSLPEAVATESGRALALRVEAALAGRENSRGESRIILVAGLETPGWGSAVQLAAAYAALGWETVAARLAATGDTQSAAGARAAARASGPGTPRELGTEALQPTTVPHLSVVSPQLVSEIATALPRRQVVLLEALAKACDRLVVALPVRAPAIPHIAASSDAAILALRPGKTTRSAAMEAKTLLETAGAPLVGAVLSDG